MASFTWFVENRVPVWLRLPGDRRPGGAAALSGPMAMRWLVCAVLVWQASSLHVLVLGDENADLMQLRMAALQEHLGHRTIVTISGDRKQPSHGMPLGRQAYRLAQMVPRLRGQSRCVLLERWARNNAQKIVFTSRMWEYVGVPADAEVAVVVNAFMEPRIRRMLGVAAAHFPWWNRARLILASDPAIVAWRQKDEIDRHLPHAEGDMAAALAMDSRPGTGTCAALEG